MIIRKPYAFLIKNFRKIHIALLIISLDIAYKIFERVSSLLFKPNLLLLTIPTIIVYNTYIYKRTSIHKKLT